MRDGVRRALVVALFSVAAARCSNPPPEPLQLDRNKLTVLNTSKDEWTNVEIWVNRYFQARVPSIAAGGRLDAPLDRFISGYGQPFDYRRIQITELTLTAKQPDGTPLELKMKFQKSGVAGALGGKE
ncbi:MAG: hypothetical protein ABI868_12185 [Acidobacteriota bacterium]